MNWRRMRAGSMAEENWSDEGTAMPVRGILLGYAASLLEVHAFTDNFLGFVFDLLSSETRSAVEDLVAAEADRLRSDDDEKPRSRPACRRPAASLAGLLRQFKQAGKVSDLPQGERPLPHLTSRRRGDSHERFLNGITRLVRHPDPRLKAPDIEIMMAEAVALELRSLDGCREGEYPEQLRELGTAFGISGDALAVVAFLFCYTQHCCFEHLCDDHWGTASLRLMAKATGIGMAGVQRALAHDGRLVEIGIVDRNIGGPGPCVQLHDELVHHLAGLSTGPLGDRFCRQDSGPVYALDTFGVPPHQAQVVATLLRCKRPCHILLHGEAGTGKTEFARAVIKEAGLQASFVYQGEKGVASDRKLALHSAAVAIPAEGSAIIMDEADTLLNTEGGHIFGGRVDKGWINDFMDQSECAIVWVVNELSSAPPSVRRRFDYSIEFQPFTRRQRAAIWKNAAAGTEMEKLVTPGMIRKLSVRYRVNAAGVASALAAAQHILTADGASRKVVLETLEELLGRHEELTAGRPGRPPLSPVAQYDISALSTDVPADRIVAGLDGFAGSSPWDRTEGGGMNLLFWGLPGTGKTEFAKYLASKLGLDLILKPASELLSCWLGETEKNIASAFAEAGREQAILFIDEADSFFTERQTANRSWEVTQTNELLEQMENHRGILICCTNLLDNLDRAALRRFTWKVQFDALTPENAVTVYRKYFTLPGKRFLQRHRKQLHQVTGLVFGDFRAVSDKFRFQDKTELTHRDVIEALKREVSYRKTTSRQLGFRG